MRNNTKKEELIVKSMMSLKETNPDFLRFYTLILHNSWNPQNTRVDEVREILRKYPKDVDFICGVFIKYRNLRVDPVEKPTPKYLAWRLLEYGADPDICLWGKNCTLFHDFLIDAHSELETKQRCGIQFILKLGPTVDTMSAWGNSVLHIIAMMLCQERHHQNPIMQQNFMDLLDYGYNPLLKDQFFARDKNSFTCLHRTAPDLYLKFRTYFENRIQRQKEALEHINAIPYCSLPCAVGELILDFSEPQKFVESC